MRAFLTGSRAYGMPRGGSDIDLIVFTNKECLDTLIELADDRTTGSGGDTGSLRFGRLNLICVTDPLDYQAWEEGTEKLISRKPVTRDEAIGVFRRLFDKAQLFKDKPEPPHPSSLMGVEVKLLELVRVPGTRQLWPADFESFITKIEFTPDDKLHWGVCADWLGEQDEPELADGFRWVSKRPSVEVKEVGGAWEFGDLPHAVRACYSIYGGFDLKTVPGLVASLVFALKKVREDAL